MRKRMVALLALLFTLLLAFPAFAGQWVQDQAGWWWQEDDGSYPVNAWKEIDGKKYYFGENGYLLLNQWVGYTYYVGKDGAMLVSAVTPDGYWVGKDGARIPDGRNVPSASDAASSGGGSQGGFVPVPINRLANYASIKKRMTDAEFQQAYNAALSVASLYAGKSREEQLFGIANSLRAMVEEGITYSMQLPHYNDPYGYFILRTASCAGCARATGLCLNILGIPYEHVNENQYAHQWCRVNVNGAFWICDAYGLYCGPEPAPYRHPKF